MTLIPAILKIDAEILISELKRLSPPKGKRSGATGGHEEEEEPMMEDGEVNGNGHAESDRNIGDDDDDGVAGGDDDDDEEEGEAEDSSSSAAVLPKSHRSKTLERLCDLLTAQQMALEILTNICSAAGKKSTSIFVRIRLLFRCVFASL